MSALLINLTIGTTIGISAVVLTLCICAIEIFDKFWGDKK